MYTEEEERMDKMLKKMEDANRSQLEVLRSQQYDIHQLSGVLVGQSAEIIKSRVERAIAEYMTSHIFSNSSFNSTLNNFSRLTD